MLIHYFEEMSVTVTYVHLFTEVLAHIRIKPDVKELNIDVTIPMHDKFNVDLFVNGELDLQDNRSSGYEKYVGLNLESKKYEYIFETVGMRVLYELPDVLSEELITKMYLAIEELALLKNIKIYIERRSNGICKVKIAAKHNSFHLNAESDNVQKKHIKKFLCDYGALNVGSICFQLNDDTLLLSNSCGLGVVLKKEDLFVRELIRKLSKVE